jgi:hypothetical protein
VAQLLQLALTFPRFIVGSFFPALASSIKACAACNAATGTRAVDSPLCALHGEMATHHS